MSLVVLEDVTLHFGDRTVLENLGLRISERDRIGLIGPNGSGKTTLLRVLAGTQEIDSGSISRARGVRVGYLPQELAVAGGVSLIDFVLSSVPGRATLHEDLEAAEAELAAAAGASEEILMELATRIADLHERVDHFDRFFSEHEALRILAGLGFSTSDRDRDLSEFSGGWQMRAVLTGLLFQRPEVLLLDEPTNHLDMPSVAWFGDFLKKYPRSFILISHDREFLNEQIERVVTFESEGFRQYTGNYERYVVARAEEEEILEGKAKNIERERERLERFVDRFRAKASKAKAAQSRVKALEKLDDVELYRPRRIMQFSFPPTERAVSEVIKVDGLRKAYGDHVVFPDLDLSVQRGEKIGIIGVNGAGKTTLLKMIAGELAADRGEIRLGGKVKVGYYAQHHADTLDQSATVYEEVSRANPKETVTRIRSILGAFLFSGDDVDKPVKVLSGGERARVALARLLVDPGNVLLMDEPTNHLDLQSAESLANSLTSYDGTIVFVSHNRSLIRTLATRIWNVENQTVETYDGTLDEYLYACSLRHGESTADGPSSGAPRSTTPSALSTEAAKLSARGNRDEEKARKRQEAERRQQRAKLVGPLQKQVADLENRIGELETAQAARSTELSDPAVYDDAPRRDKLLGEYQRDAEKLEELTARWEHAVESLEAKTLELEQELG